ncbi:MAG TPA: DUF3147 family protein [Candidatus Dormibacteraeota bacterium]|nr:DUF3147 family protein [Candidatus Dormibacteraeota bacterium]
MDGRQVLEDDLEPVGFDWSKLSKTHPPELLIRFVFGGGIALVSALAGSLVGPRFGGLFLAFPAVLPATLTLIEKKEGTAKAWADASGGVLGALGLAAFAFTALQLLRANPMVALTLAVLAWVLVSGGLYLLLRETGLFLKQDKLLTKLH